ncbi:MAG: radical SAM protein, partial [Nanoarchaeota archaeon]|nr:radical SAM protein [Nanoarchaeota archaeon]
MNYLSMIKYMFNKKTKGPIQLIHFVTSRCNARCEHCFYWKNLNQNNDLTLDEIKKITKTLPDLRFLLISGGEPFLRKDLTGIISSYCDNTKTQEVSIPTNGLLKEKIVSDCKTILNKYPKVILNIVISLDGPKESHNKIRGVDCYDKAIETFNEIKKLKIYSNFKLSIVSTLMLSNQ